jgi:peptidoglycan biosynthesis protein MviN/MurJ (putative lipid II flippase)
MKNNNFTKQLSIGIGLVTIVALPLSAALAILTGHLREHFFLRHPQNMAHLREHASNIHLLALCLATVLWVAASIWMLWACKKAKELKTQQRPERD